MALVEAGAGGLGIGGLANRPNGISVRLPDIPLWVPQAAREEIAGLCLDTMRLALQYAAGAISGEAPVDSGQLAQSFTADPATSTGGIELTGVDLVSGVEGRVFSTLPYAVVMDQGRRAGQPISRAGIDAIGLWAQRKLGMSAAEADHAKYAIANVIVARGIEGTQYFAAGVDKAAPTVNQLFAALADTVAQALTTKTGKRRIVNSAVAVRRRRGN